MGKFNEREYELCYNAEFMRLNTTSLLGIPYIPSTREEGAVGYDVEFRIKDNEFTRSLFLQYKITYYAENRGAKNKYIWDCYGGPYYRLRIDKLDKSKQHNLLFNLATKGEEVFYCAPIFVTRNRLELYAANNQVIDMSRYFDPLAMGEIVDFDQHHVSCDPAGSFGYYHSEPRKLESVITWETLKNKGKIQMVNKTYVEGLLRIIEKDIHDAYGAAPSVPDNIKEREVFMTVSYLLFRYYNLRWFILK